MGNVENGKTAKAAARPWSRVGLSTEQWITLLKRRLAGEAIRALAEEHGVHVSTIYKQAEKRGYRLKDWPDAVPPRKGPAPVVVMTRAGAPAAVECGELAFEYRPDDPVGTVDNILAKVAPMAREGRDDVIGRLHRLAEATMRVALGRRKLRVVFREAGEVVVEAGGTMILHPHQTPPPGRWRTWLLLGGRGAGKTLAGASWLADQAGASPDGRLALIGPTLHDVREVMIEGASGIRSLARWTAETRPVYEPSRRRLVFANGCVAQAFSAEDPDSLRGPQFSAAWADEFCAWPAAGTRGAGETLALLRMGLRRPEPGGGPPRLCVTTTPRPTRALKALRAERSCESRTAPTALNAAHLAEGFLDELRALYGGTRREAQELEGQVVDVEGALFTAEMMEAANGGGDGPTLERIVVAIDPPATAGGDACGIVAAGSRRGAGGAREAVVLADRSQAGLSPLEWARRAMALAAEVGASRIVAEVNQGGDMVRETLRAAGCALKVREVRATRGKRLRAEPVAALYEQGRVRHAPADGRRMRALEEELMALGEDEVAGSLDRADALVWAVTDLLIDRPDGETGPRIGVL